MATPRLRRQQWEAGPRARSPSASPCSGYEEQAPSGPWAERPQVGNGVRWPQALGLVCCCSLEPQPGRREALLG